MFRAMKRIRAVGLVLRDGYVLLIHRINMGKEYYVFPGGGVEDGETIEEAVLRELKEETSIDTKIEKLLYHHMYDDNTEHFFYFCRYISGEPAFDDEDEHQSKENFYEPMWYRVTELPKLLLYPLEIRDWFLDDIKTGFQYVPREATLKVSELRQTLDNKAIS